MPKKIRTLYLAADAAELRPLIALGRKYLRVDGPVAYLAAGIGPVAASFGLTHFLEDYRPERIIAIGTAGVINEKKFQIGDVVVAKSVSTASGIKSVYTPKQQPHKILIPVGAQFIAPADLPQFAGAMNRAPTAKVYSPQEITRSEDWIDSLSKAGHDVEHLESFAYAFVAQKFRIPIQIVLGLTNIIGPTAHREWVKNARTMLEKACLAAKAL